MPLVLLLLLLTALPLSHQLPTQERQPPAAPACLDPLHHLAQETRCQQQPGDAGRRHPVYIMTEDDCPAKSVCLSDAEVASCPHHHHQQHQANAGILSGGSPCPPDSPVSLLKYSPLSFACPRRRCVRLACFQEFCRARRRLQGDNDDSSRSSSQWWKPLLLPAMPQQQQQQQNEPTTTTCHYLHCGCPYTEAQLLADGCPAPAANSQQKQHQQLLILQVDRQTGCPVKRCSSQLPEGAVELELLFSTTSSTTAFATATTPPPTPCPEPAVACPASTSELTVANPDSGCPLRICLLPELLIAGAVTTKESQRVSTSAAKSTTRATATATTAAQVETVAEATATTSSPVKDESTATAATETPPVTAVTTATESAENTTITTTRPRASTIIGRS